jgi:glycosyltransferase involved in cell wall biosynthesis
MGPTFSVIIPTFDRPGWLREAVASVLAQDFDDFECVVVDDGSTLPVELPDDPRIRLLRHSENKGLPAALNTGIRAALGDYVTFLDDDDLLTPDRLSMTVPALGRARVVLCGSETIGGRTRQRNDLEGRVYDTILDSWAPPKGAAVIPRADLLPFDERYLALEDLEWWLRISDRLEFTTIHRTGYLIRPHDRPRNLNGPADRIPFSRMLLEERHDYFASHRRAAAQRWFSMGLIAMKLGDNRLARSAFARSLVCRPVPRRFGHLALAIRPSRPSTDPARPERDRDLPVVESEGP